MADRLILFLTKSGFHREKDDIRFVSPVRAISIKNMRYHLAARYARRVELCGYRDQLFSIGDTVTSRWLEFRKMPSWSCGIARENCEDLMAADVVVVFTEMPNAVLATGGRHVESLA
jgi:hypothetical protein